MKFQLSDLAAVGITIGIAALYSLHNGKKAEASIPREEESMSASENRMDIIADAIDQASEMFGVRKALLWGVAKHESGFNPDAVNEKENAVGLCQVRMHLHKELLSRWGIETRKEYKASVPAQVFTCAAILKEKEEIGGSEECGTWLFNGAGNVKRTGRGIERRNGKCVPLPKATYAKKVYRRVREFEGKV